MRIEDIVLGKTYKVTDTCLHILDIGTLVRATNIVESIVTNEAKFVKVLVVDEKSEHFDIVQVMDPKDLEEAGDDD